MKIQRSTNTHGSILPSTFGVIAALPANYLHHEAHGLRHPLSAYGTSIRLITAQWTKTFSDLATLRARYYVNKDDDFLMDVAQSYSQLLHRLNEHQDACYSVLRSLSSVTESKPSRLHTQYLDKNKLVGWKQFRDATRIYRENHIGLIVNSLKHAQCELCPMYFHSATEFRAGYYLRNIQAGGVLGPDPKLHQGGNTAISFNHDMLMHFWWLYRIGDLLSTAITSFVSATYGQVLVPVAYSLPEAKWDDVSKQCAALTPDFFPNEWGASYPRVIYQQIPELLTLEFPTSVRGHKMIGEIEIRTMTTVDGEHPNERVPYFNN